MLAGLSNGITTKQKNASEPIWFSGVAASMRLCLDLGAVLCVSSFGFIKPGHQSVVPFLVFSLIEGDVSVLLDALFDELGSDVDFSFQLRKFTLKGRGIEALGKDLLVYGYKLFLLVNYLIGGPEEQFFYFILGECRGGAFLTIELVIALTDDLPVGVVAVPDLRPIDLLH